MRATRTRRTEFNDGRERANESRLPTHTYLPPGVQEREDQDRRRGIAASRRTRSKQASGVAT